MARLAFEGLQFPARGGRSRLCPVSASDVGGARAARFEAELIARLALDYLFRMSPGDRTEDAVEECISRSMGERHSGLFLGSECLALAVEDAADMVRDYVTCVGAGNPTLATNVELVSFFEGSDAYVADTIDRVDLLDGGESIELIAYKFSDDEVGAEPDELDELMVAAWIVLAGENLARRTSRISIVNLRSRESEIWMVQPADLEQARATIRADRTEGNERS